MPEVVHTIATMSDDLQQRLRRLGVVKGARHLKTPPISPPPAGDDQSLTLVELLPGGQVLETSHGGCFVLDRVYSLSHEHGPTRLDALTQLPLSTVAQFCQDERLADLDYRDLLFLDTETTGLSGAGTIAFMVGVAFFENQAFVVRQYFLRDHGDEPAMLRLLAELLADRPIAVTFNGRSFDLPLLDTRYLMNRMDDQVGDLRQLPNIDLLPPSRRLWRSRLQSCSLASLEESLLGVRRSLEDVPGWAIPGLYMDYLRTGDAREMARVFYHNRIDMLSMATLAERIIRQFSRPQVGDEPLDVLSLARWQVTLGLSTEAEVNLLRLLDEDIALDTYQQALTQLAWLLKRHGRRSEAVSLWQQLAVTSFDDVSAHIELAKYYEWHDIQLERALDWTTQALALSDVLDPTRADMIVAELVHRQARLERKIAGLEEE